MPRLVLVAAGCGRVFERFHLPALRTVGEWSLGGVVDTDKHRLQWVEGQAPGLPSGTSLRAVLQSVRPDAVLISTSPETHYDLAATALREGAHVLLEKPMTLQPAEADMLLEIARSAGRQVRIGYNRRFRPGYRRLRALLAAGRQQPVRAKFELCTDPRAWQSCSPRPKNDYTGDELLHDLASHELDLVPWLLGRDVTALSARYLAREAARKLIAIDLRFTDGLEGDCLAGYQPGYIERLAVETREGACWIGGPGGVARAGGGRLSRILARHRLGVRTVARTLARKLARQPGETLETFRLQLIDWAHALGSGEGKHDAALGADGSAGARCVALVDACRRSLAQEGRWIEIPTRSLAPRS